MNPSRGLSAALLCALLGASAAAHDLGVHAGAPPPSAGSAFDIPAGRCAGKGGPDAVPIEKGPAYDLRAHPLSAADLAVWRVAGYGVDASSSHLLSPRGRELPAAEYARLSAPFDAAVDTMTNRSWSTMIFYGYRLQDSTCRLLDPVRREPVARIEVLELERQVADGGGNSALEELLVVLKHADTRRPPPPEVLARMKQLEARGERLPESLRALLLDPKMTVGAIEKAAEGDYGRLMRAWEGSRDLKSVTGGALPPVEGFNIDRPRNGRIEPWEQVIGDGFSSDMRTAFGRTAAGRELLSQFKDSHGREDLPKMTVLKMSQKPDDAGYGGAAAVYDNSSRTVILSHWFVVGQILEDVKPAERAALGSKLADSGALSEYLRSHPDKRRAVADRLDVVVFHELTHAWQARRGPLAVETARGNAPGGIVLSDEHEAFFGMYRYLHEKIMNDPSAALRSPDFPAYLAVMNDPYKYRDQITRQYQETFPGSTDLKTLKQLQEERRTILGVPVSGGATAWARAVLVRAGLARGDEALKEASAVESATETRYFHEVIPRMRSQATDKLPASFIGLGRADLGLQLLATVPPPAGAPDRRPQLADAADRLLSSPSQLTLQQRLAAYSVLGAEREREKKPWSAATDANYRRDAFEYAAEVAAQAQAEGDRSRRGPLIASARAWLRAASPKDPRTAALKRTLDALEKKR